MNEMNNQPEIDEIQNSELQKRRRSIETIYYFHGYGGFLTPEKREILQQFGKVIHRLSITAQPKLYLRLLILLRI